MEADEVYAILNKKLKGIQGSMGGVIGPGAPIGEVIAYMGTAAPAGYLICDGTEYAIEDYPYLAKHFEDNFGSVNYFSGDGTTTFAVPDLRGEFLRGAGTNGHASQGNGAAVGVHQNGSHITNVLPAGGESGSTFQVNQRSSYYIPEDRDYAPKESVIVANYRPSSTVQNNSAVRYYTARPTNTSVLYCIKYRPTYFTPARRAYSYGECQIGTWVDGKPLYEKTVDFGALPDAGIKEVPHGIMDVGDIWVHDGFVSVGKGGYPLVYADVSNNASNWVCSVDRDVVRFRTGSDRGRESAFVILRYTKTTG